MSADEGDIRSKKNYDATLMRVTGNLLSGAPGMWINVSPDTRRASVQDAVETARIIAEEVQKLTPGRVQEP